jgi:hypothetical protein
MDLTWIIRAEMIPDHFSEKKFECVLCVII